jgi:hypothetical protein
VIASSLKSEWRRKGLGSGRQRTSKGLNRSPKSGARRPRNALLVLAVRAPRLPRPQAVPPNRQRQSPERTSSPAVHQTAPRGGCSRPDHSRPQERSPFCRDALAGRTGKRMVEKVLLPGRSTCASSGSQSPPGRTATAKPPSGTVFSCVTPKSEGGRSRLKSMPAEFGPNGVRTVGTSTPCSLPQSML